MIVGILLLNVFGAGIDVARRLIADGREHDNFKEVSLLLCISDLLSMYTNVLVRIVFE